MKNLRKAPGPGIRLFLGLGLVSLFIPACCPTGAFDDNFGRFYSLVTIATENFQQPFLTYGTVDTRDMGCGVWSIIPVVPTDLETPLSWVAQNPDPNPADQCCYAFRFDGQVTGSGCSLIVGEYQNIGGKCEGSGQMYLASAR